MYTYWNLPYTKAILTPKGVIIIFEECDNCYYILRFDPNEKSDFPWDFYSAKWKDWSAFSGHAFGNSAELYGFKRLKDAVNAVKELDYNPTLPMRRGT